MATTVTKNDQAAEAPRKTLIADPELTSMNRIAKHLLALNEGQRLRVMSWLVARFAPEIIDAAQKQE